MTCRPGSFGPDNHSAERSHRHPLISAIAEQLQLPYDEIAAISIEELDRRCRRRQGCSLLVSVRTAEAVVRRDEQRGDRDVQRLGDDHEIVDGPPGPPSQPHGK